MTLKCGFLSSLLIVLAGSVFGQVPVWTQMPGSPGLASDNTRHDDIVFLGETNGWSARGRGGLFRTTDGGASWRQTLNKPATHFRCIGFLTESRGFAGNLGTGSYDTGVTDTNVLYQTTDGGETWTVVPGLNEAGMKGFCAMHVLDSQHIYGGGRVRGPAHFVKSENGGTNWTVVDLKAAGIMGGIMDVYFKDATNGFVVGMDTNDFFNACGGNYHGRIAKTTDGGATWTAVADTSRACTYFWKMSWPTPEVGYTSLQQNGSSSSLIFYKTIDGGNSWTSNGVPYTSIGIPSFTLLQGIGFITPNEGWVGGPSSVSPPENNFLHTRDGGLSWTREGYSDSRSINRIRVYPKFAVASGAKLHIYKVPLGITVSPQSQTKLEGSTVAFNVTARGTPPLSFQWRFMGTNIVLAEANSYSITNVRSSDAGPYDVVVRDFSGAVTSAIAVLTITSASSPPTITTPPTNQTVLQNATATFTVGATGTAPLFYQWQFNDANVSDATNTTLLRTNAQLSDAGNYYVIVTNSAGSVTSAIATLTVIQTNGILFRDDFDQYSVPLTVTNTGTTNGYKIVYRSSVSTVDLKAIFGFDYSTVTNPTVIPPAPASLGGTRKGLFLTANKDAVGGAAAVNLYPTGQVFSGNFALKFDFWLNWANPSTSTEHALFGINHSGNATNRIGQSFSDGLFFAVDADGGIGPTTTTLRDFSVFRGGTNGAPILMTTSNTIFGPAPLLGPQFDHSNSGFTTLFPSQTIPGGVSTPAGTAGQRWISGEIRAQGGRITWLLNGAIVAQYTNTFGYTNGTVLIGYNDHFDTIGDATSFVIFDNIRVEAIAKAPVLILSPRIAGNEFSFSFATEIPESYRVEKATTLSPPNWILQTNFVGDGKLRTVSFPLSTTETGTYFRVTRP